MRPVRHHGGVDARALFDKLAVDLADDGVVADEVAGHRVLQAKGQPFVALDRDDMVFRLPRSSTAHAAAARLLGAGPVAPPVGPDPGEWVRVPLEECQIWEQLARSALDSL